MNTKRVAIAILWTYSCWMIGGVAEFIVGTPAVLGLAVGIAGAVFFGLDPLGVVWPKTEQNSGSVARPISVETRAVGDASAHI
jgi:hypothetical protein